MTVTFLIPSAEGVSINVAEPTTAPVAQLLMVARASGNPCADADCAPRHATATSKPPIACGTDFICLSWQNHSRFLRPQSGDGSPIRPLTRLLSRAGRTKAWARVDAPALFSV